VNNSNYYRDIIKKCYLEYLNREPDEAGFNYYLKLLLNEKLDENGLIKIFQNSKEYKLSHPTELDINKITVNDWMKQDWNERAKMDPFFVITTGHSENETEFWNSGRDNCNEILGIDSHRYENILGNKDPSKMRVLEIGCGIGRILIPMSKIFGEVIGVDVSYEMVKIGKKYIENIPNCKIIENSGSDLSMFSCDYFDFCYSFIVFQHIPKSSIVENYIKEVSRVLKSEGIFRFQVRGKVESKSKVETTWDGVQFTSDEIHKIVQVNNFEIIEEGNDKDEYYWLTFKLKKN